MVSLTVPRRDFGRSFKNEDDNHLSIPATVPIIGLGCSSFSTFFWTDEEATQNMGEDKFNAATLQRDHLIVQGWIATIHHAIRKCGINLLDTAPWYGHGTSEIVVGWALQDLLTGETPKIKRDDICINTKVGRYEADPRHQFDFSRDMTLASAQRSLQRLGGKQLIGYVDVLQLHDPEFSPTLELLLEETIPAMVECRSKGWCKALGLTGYPLEVQYQLFQATLEKYGKETAPKIWDQALTYCHFNLHDSSLVNRRIVGDPNKEASNRELTSFADMCYKHNLGLLAAAPLSMGLLTNNKLAEWHPALGSKLEQACRSAAEICRAKSVDIATLALLYAMSHPKVPCTILGMKDIQQVDAASSLARRFAVVDWNMPNLTQQDVLQQVLTEVEWEVIKILNDKQNGPFAGLEEKGQDDDFTSLYQWDGVKEAHRFWKAIPEASFEEWQWRRT
ncbi:putative oxidoreductase related to aryl-alcohol dehydrogenase [Nitzschia inconspicua]|uniref:Oxidoreductase related to aryl-alcohol dehydrogenase n=1 Tax=Nitzschia inconspicua TaxID=303405 RepID=A0A9K3LK58_9STRA|nr:putative oxidoreductase related to aryl-alcohol dehydrogenase [Nitzschia inconspicua]